MSLKVILRNVFSFLEVLESALMEGVASWDLRALDNAFNWAHYVEQIYRQSEGKPYQPELRDHVAKLGQVKLWRLGEMTVGLELLGKASDTLRQALLQNPCVTDQVWEALVSRSTQSAGGKDAFINACWSLCQEHGTLQGLAALQAELLGCTATTTDGSTGQQAKMAAGRLGDCRTRADARLLVRFVVGTLSRCRTDEETQRRRADLENVITEIAKGSKGREILLSSLIVVETEVYPRGGASSAGLQEREQGCGTRTRELLLNVVLGVAKKETRLWTDVPVLLLTEVATRSTAFYEAYTAFLKSTGNSYIKSGDTWLEAEAESGLPYNTFLDHWCHLCENQRTSSRTIDLLRMMVGHSRTRTDSEDRHSRTRTDSPDSCVWQNVCNALNVLDNG